VGVSLPPESAHRAAVQAGAEQKLILDEKSAMPKTAKHRIFSVPVAKVYPYLIAKAEKKGRTKAEVDQVTCWLTGYSPKQLEKILQSETNFETFFQDAPQKNPKRKLITGLICGVRVEEIKDPLMRELRYLDKLVDELAKGKPMEKILRS
jgi:hypothetical protein